MTENKWQVNRAGILNYWYYDEEEFQFADGRLLLRGSNGSGKSVTMQSLVTLLLDGVKRADRLDSFGSRARRIEDYLRYRGIDIYSSPSKEKGRYAPDHRSPDYPGK